MTDIDIYERANVLSEEEALLYQQAGDGRGLTTQESARLAAIKVELDRCYDLLHQRRARRQAGLDPDGAELRPADVVEQYDQ